MILVTPEIRDALRANDAARYVALAQGMREPDPVPVVRFFNPVGQATWLAAEMDEHGILFGLADLGFGSPELGSFALAELESVRLPFGLGIERDRSEEHTSELQSLMRISYAVFCLKRKKDKTVRYTLDDY